MLAETISSSIAIIKDGRIAYVNRAGKELCGYTMDEMLSAPAFMVVRGEQAPSRCEFRLVTKNGDVRWVECTHGAIDLDGDTAVICKAVDITEGKMPKMSSGGSRTRWSRSSGIEPRRWSGLSTQYHTT